MPHTPLKRQHLLYKAEGAQCDHLIFARNCTLENNLFSIKWSLVTSNVLQTLNDIVPVIQVTLLVYFSLIYQLKYAPARTAGAHVSGYLNTQ